MVQVGPWGVGLTSEELQFHACSLLSSPPILPACLLFAARTFKLVNKVFQMQLECLAAALPPSLRLPSDSWLAHTF